MAKSVFIGALAGAFAFNSLNSLLHYLFKEPIEEYDEYDFWKFRRLDSLIKDDDLCEVGYTFVSNGVSYKKISDLKWLAEVKTSDEDPFPIGCKLIFGDDIYIKEGDRFWTIEKMIYV